MRPDRLEAYPTGTRISAARLRVCGWRISQSKTLEVDEHAEWPSHASRVFPSHQHLLIKELDRALATLVVDLEQQNLLDRTLIVVYSPSCLIVMSLYHDSLGAPLWICRPITPSCGIDLSGSV